MNENDNRWRIAVLCGVVLVGAACSPGNKEIGSACRQGVCPGALVKRGPVCSAGQVNSEFGTMPAVSPGTRPSPFVMCLPRPLPKDDHGKVQCQVLLRDNHAPAGHPCPDSPSLSPAPDGRSCLVHQVSASLLDASMNEGWYYDENYDECPDPPVAIRLTEGALPKDVDANVIMSCNTLRMEDPDAAEADAGSSPNDPSECVLPEDSARHSSSVGDRCVPKLVPSGGFHEHELYVESGSGQCDTGVCLVAFLSGDPRPNCNPATAGERGCAKPSDVKEQVYCSRRCRDDDDSCGDGFSCEQGALSNGPEGLRGGYCIRIPN